MDEYRNALAKALLAKTDGEMRPVERNKLLGLLADGLSSVNQYAQRPDPNGWFGKADFGAAALSNLFGVPALAETADNLSYGRNLTRGQGMARQMLPATAEAALAVAPAVARWPKQAAGLAAGLLGQGDANALRAATVFHGSPHKFDAFDASKIGTGQGAQSYGHGLYLAESADVAKTYVPKRPLWNGKEVDSYSPTGAITYADGSTAHIADAQWSKFRDAMESAPRNGNVYKVDLPDNAISRMLDWYKPLSQQAPQVRAAVAAAAPKNRSGQSMVELDASGDEIMRALGLGDGASELLRSKGIPGVRYFDGGSRNAGSGTSNYVVFPGEESALTILERNGVKLNALGRK